MNQSDVLIVYRNSSLINFTFIEVNWTNTSDLETTVINWTSLFYDQSLIVLILFLFSVVTVIGNLLVILAVIRERHLHTATNYFITSLAVADCLVGLLVMPVSALYEVLDHIWFFGPNLCDVWRSLDVLLSTASILNLCVISLDRYWAITNPITYPRRMTRSRSLLLIAVVWICASTISFPAIIWWRAVRKEPIPTNTCPFTEHLGYLVFSSTISFYLPLFVMLFTYYRIYKAAVAQSKSLRLGTKQILLGAGELALTLRMHRGGTSSKGDTSANLCVTQSGAVTENGQTFTYSDDDGLDSFPATNLTVQKTHSLSKKVVKFAKEKKAAKTLGIVMGVFVICWLPFFVVNLLSGFCLNCIWNQELVLAIVTWLGWTNSSMNPIIYACWSRDFRRAFLRILLFTCCPNRIRQKYQSDLRRKTHKRFSSHHYRSSSCPLQLNSLEQTYI